MSYQKWFEKQAEKHKEIVEKSKSLSDEELIDYFEYQNLKEKEKDFCPLFAKDKKCHNIKYLNCYLCGCPYFRFNDKGFKKIGGKTLYSYCSINSKNARNFENETSIHLDCSNCKVPHTKKFILKNFSREWSEIMKNCGKE